MIRTPSESTRPTTLVPYTTLFRSTTTKVLTPRATAAPTNSRVARSRMIHPFDALPSPRLLSPWIKKPLRPSAVFSSTASSSMTTGPRRSEAHTSELQSLMRISYAVFCLKKKINQHQLDTTTPLHHNNSPTHTDSIP